MSGSALHIIVGAFAAFASWAFYGSGAGIDLTGFKTLPHLQLSALAGAFSVGVVGARWIESESAKRLLQATVKVAAPHIMSREQAERLQIGAPSKVLQEVTQACEACPLFPDSLPAHGASA